MGLIKMQTKDYKEIAKRINEFFVDLPSISLDKRRILINSLSDYFENNEHIVGSIDGKPIFKKLFNRKQFKKWCGVE